MTEYGNKCESERITNYFRLSSCGTLLKATGFLHLFRGETITFCGF